jgi:hypothetical protein
MLKAFDNGLHGRIQQLEKEKEEVKLRHLLIFKQLLTCLISVV